MKNNKILIRNCVLSYKCDSTWGKLDETDDVDIKFCDNCKKEVFFCHDDDDLVKAITLNRCVAFEKEEFHTHVIMGMPTPFEE